MKITDIEKRVTKLIQKLDKESFIYELLLAYDLPKASVTRLKKGNLNLSKDGREVIWKKKLRFRAEESRDLHLTVTELAKSRSHDERFIIATDFKTLLAVDTRTDEKLDIDLEALPKHFDFFLPWSGMEKTSHVDENPADVKAAEKMAKLFDEIKKDNPDESPAFIHGLNVFLSRLLFCFFAEDTGIFLENQFTTSVSSHTQADGSDLNEYLNKLFKVLDTPKNEREHLPEYLAAFPYVNGGLFEKSLKSPVFTRRSRQAIIDSGELNWSAINPDIFGSMIQAVITPEHRGGLGMHYTSVPNIMKVIEPLFLNDLKEAFEKAKRNPKKLNELLHRLSKIKIFDPACGSGNFLIIAYKELRRLEIEIISHLQELQRLTSGFSRDSEQLSIIPKSQLDLAASYQVELFSRIQLTQFYGIELDDFAHEIAQLSLWLAEHQMNTEFKKEFGQTNPTLPLKEAGQIVHANACVIDWEDVCFKSDKDEIYLLGNPPYLGARNQSSYQKSDMSRVLKNVKGKNSLDYIACWFYKASKFISGTSHEFAFVSTNSVCQGQQVSLLWPCIFGDGNDIKFSYPAFYWSNNAKNKAVVAVVIVGVKSVAKKTKKYIIKDHSREVSNISPYLSEGSDLVINKRQTSLSMLPPLVFGNQSVDGGNLILSDNEKVELLSDYPLAEKFVRPFYGWDNLSKNEPRWCLWITEDQLEEALMIQGIVERIQNVKDFREQGGQVARSLTSTPFRFRYVHEAQNHFIAVGRNSSETREYLPAAFLSKPAIAGETLQVVYDPEPFLFGLISSKMHMLWVKAVAGGMKLDILYSVTVCYNTFPFPPISDQKKSDLTQSGLRIIEIRERFSDKTLAELYNPSKMPKDLREAHSANDEVMDRCYRSKPFESDAERLEYLFRLYERMISQETQADSSLLKKSSHA